tara:strand:- start:18445 stop:19074 length:630 start_codon:yes stop_codon:yes gene_type:complete
MNIIKHRINKSQELSCLKKVWGIEIDVRYHENDLILCHDPFYHHVNNCDKLEDFLANWVNNGTIILNLKSEGIEDRCISLMAKFNITNWFFLDMSMPYLVNYANLAKSNKVKNFSTENLSVRFSDKEPIEYALSFSKKVRWVWVDHFDYFPLDSRSYSKLREANFKICLVSPDIQKSSRITINDVRDACKDMEIEAICTKSPTMWSSKT